MHAPAGATSPGRRAPPAAAATTGAGASKAVASGNARGAQAGPGAGAVGGAKTGGAGGRDIKQSTVTWNKSHKLEGDCLITGFYDFLLAALTPLYFGRTAGFIR